MSPASHLCKSFDLGLLKALHLRCSVRDCESPHSQTWVTFSWKRRQCTISLSPFSCISLNLKGVKDFSYCYLPEWLKVGIHRQCIQVTTWLSPFRMLFSESEISLGRGVPVGPSFLHLSARRRPTDTGTSILSLVVSVDGSRADPYWTDVRMCAKTPQCHPGTGNFALSGLCLFWFTALEERAKLQQRYCRCLERSKSPWRLHRLLWQSYSNLLLFCRVSNKLQSTYLFHLAKLLKIIYLFVTL